MGVLINKSEKNVACWVQAGVGNMRNLSFSFPFLLLKWCLNVIFERKSDSLKRNWYFPIKEAAALAGTTFSIDREYTKKNLIV